MHEADDNVLINRFKDGDTSAFEEIVLKYQDRIYNLCRHILGNAHDAEDAAQDVFLKAYQNLGKFKPAASLHFIHGCIGLRSIPALITGEDRSSSHYLRLRKRVTSLSQTHPLIHPLPRDCMNPNRLVVQYSLLLAGCPKS